MALHRTTGSTRLLDVAQPLADLVVRSFGMEEGRVDGVDGQSPAGTRSTWPAATWSSEW